MSGIRLNKSRGLQDCAVRPQYRTSRPMLFGWLGRCAIFGFVLLARKITRCISHISTDAVRLVLFQIYAPQTKILEGRTNVSECFFEALSAIRSPNRVFKPLKSASKNHSETFVRPSKIFVWEQPSATHPRFGQTCLFTILPKL